jgi:hypothetical protein
MYKFYLFFSFIFLSCTTSERTEVVRNYDAIHEEAKKFVKENDFDESFYYLIDMSIHSGKNRFFIIDLNDNKITYSNLVTHGSCDQLETNETKWEKAKFSYKINSHCSMKGKFKIGARDYSSWGINVKYWLHGLEKTNHSAVDRVVVLHSWSAVSNDEIHPKYSPLSWGCPAVSNEFMKKIDKQLKNSKKPVLLWIID